MNALLKFRIYRLPGDKRWWRIDTGEGSQVIYCQDWYSEVPSCSRDSALDQMPRAWIEVTAHCWCPEGLQSANGKFPGIDHMCRVVQFLNQIPQQG